MTTAVATAQPTALSTLLADPDKLREFPIETVERLFALDREMRSDAARAEYFAAFNTLQSQLQPVRKEGRNKETRSWYAKLEHVCAMLDPLLIDNGFSTSVSTEPCDQPELLRFVMTVRHNGGHAEQHRLEMPVDYLGPKGAPVKTRAHGTGSSFTLAERYLKVGVFNVQTYTDDDGNAAGGGPGAEKITPAQADELNAMFDEVGGDKRKFVNIFGVDAMPDLTQANFLPARNILRSQGGARMSEPRVLYKNMVGGWVLDIDGVSVPVVRADIAGETKRQRDALLEAAKEAASWPLYVDTMKIKRHIEAATRRYRRMRGEDRCLTAPRAHTPPPWKAEYLSQHRYRITAQDGKTTICDIALWLTDYGEQQRNAALMAAAPETARQRDLLLKVAKALRDEHNHEFREARIEIHRMAVSMPPSPSARNDHPRLCAGVTRVDRGPSWHPHGLAVFAHRDANRAPERATRRLHGRAIGRILPRRADQRLFVGMDGIREGDGAESARVLRVRARSNRANRRVLLQGYWRRWRARGMFARRAGRSGRRPRTQMPDAQHASALLGPRRVPARIRAAGAGADMGGQPVVGGFHELLPAVSRADRAGGAGREIPRRAR